MTDTVFISDLRVDTVIGVNDWEREVEQTLYLDLELGIDTRACAESDDLSKSVDYAELSQFVADFIHQDPALLIETLGNRLVDALLEEYSGLDSVGLTLRKPQALANAACTGIRIARQR